MSLSITFAEMDFRVLPKETATGPIRLGEIGARNSETFNIRFAEIDEIDGEYFIDLDKNCLVGVVGTNTIFRQIMAIDESEHPFVSQFSFFTIDDTGKLNVVDRDVVMGYITL